MHKKLPWEDELRAMRYYARKYRYRFDFVRTTTLLRFAAIKAWKLGSLS